MRAWNVLRQLLCIRNESLVISTHCMSAHRHQTATLTRQSGVTPVLRSPHRSNDCHGFATLTRYGLAATSGEIVGVILAVQLAWVYRMRRRVIRVIKRNSEPQYPLHLPCPCHARLADRSHEAETITTQHEANRAKQGSARRLS